MKKVQLLVLFIITLLVFSCKKDTFITSSDARLMLSADTLRFDTVFTTVGSITQSFKIRNDNNQKLQISSILLKGGTNSPFKINVDGTPGPEVKNLEIEANDSTYVFVSVVAKSNNGASRPFIIQDSIEIAYNGNESFVQLETWGQNAHFLRSGKVTGQVTWKDDLPYVIMGSLQVDTNATLTIEKGCRVYLHADAPFIVDGSLKVNGEKYDSTRIYFTGDRLDDPYKDYPGSWPGIYFRGTSKDNLINYAVIRNAYQGIVAEQPSTNGNYKLILNQCIIDNIYDAGILAAQSSLQANNCLISNCGKNIELLYGGNYQFVHCTVVDISNSYVSHENPVLQVANYITQGNTYAISDISAVFQNCIFWGQSGTVEDEVVTSRQGTAPYSVNFQNCLWRVKTVPANVTTSNIINNQDPVFDSINTQKHYFSFRLKNDSPAINQGVNTGLPYDLDGLQRAVGLPDLGAYEKQ